MTSAPRRRFGGSDTITKKQETAVAEAPQKWNASTAQKMKKATANAALSSARRLACVLM